MRAWALSAVAVLAIPMMDEPADARWKCCKIKKIKIPDRIPNPIKTVGQVIHDTGKAVGKAGGDIAHATTKAVADTGNTLEKAGQDTGKALEKAGQDTGKILEKAGQDTAKESGRAVANVAEFGQAVGRFANRTATDTADNLSDAEKRIREGKIADAFWHLAVDPVKDGESRAAKLVQESSLANTVGQVAASAYGGPGGAAAYAAWYTYRSTGDAELALRVGIISGATSAAMSAINVQPTMADASAAAHAGTVPVAELTVSETAKKAALAGAVGGLAVAASGGDANAIRDAFLLGGGMVLVQDGYKAFTGQQGVYTEGAERPAFCTTSLPVNGAPGSACAPKPEWFKRNDAGDLVLDMSKVPPDTSYVGLATNTADTAWPTNLVAETGPAMNTFAKVPGMNAMSIFHDQWVVSWSMTGPAVQATIIPAVVLTYMGTEAPLQNAIQDAAAAQSNNAAPAEQARTTSTLGHNQSFIAIKGNQTRSFFVATGNSPQELACILVYQKDAIHNGADLAPWYALKDASFCDIKADALARKHADEGWTVLVR